MALIEVKVPDIGDFKDVAVIELLVKVGDTIAAEQSLVTVESDKASMEIPASHAGVVKELKVALGDKLNEGMVLLMLETVEAAAVAAPAAAAAPAAVAAAPAAVAAPAAAPVAAPSPAASSDPVQVLVPDIGDFDEVAVIEVMVKLGDTIKAEQSLITVESDKASMEIPSSHAGVVRQVLVKLGDKVAKGSPVVVLEVVGGASASSAPVAALAAAAVAPAVAIVTAAPATDRISTDRTAPTAALPPHEPTIFKGEPIKVFNHGDMMRDFTYIDDIVEGVIRVLDKPATPSMQANISAPCRLFNIGNNQPEKLLDFIGLLENAIGKTAQKEFLSMQAGDVKATYADTRALEAWVGFKPSMSLQVGVENFVSWYRSFYFN